MGSVEKCALQAVTTICQVKVFHFVLTGLFSAGLKCLGITTKIECIIYIYTVGTESIQTPLNFSLFVILQPFAKII